MRSDKHTKKSNRKTWLKRTALIIGVLLAFGLGTYTGYYGWQVVQLLADVSDDTPDESRDTSESDETIREMHPISILILGLDEENGTSRSDSMLVATVNPRKESTKIVSIPRDTLITLPNSENERYEKINALHAIYGVSGTMDFIEDYLTIPISFYATLNFDGLVDLVDAVGGITVDSPLAFTVQDSDENMDAIQIEEGIQTLDGEEALGYTRMRQQDPRGDFGRQERQREVIEALTEELLSFGSITNLTPIINAIRPNLQTNMTPQQMLAVAANYQPAANTIDSIEISGTDEFFYVPQYGQELYVFRPFEQSLSDLQRELRQHMEVEELSQYDQDEILETIDEEVDDLDEDTELDDGN